MDREIKITGNTSVSSGVITVYYSRRGRSPLGFEFEDKNGYKCSFAVHSECVRELLVFLAENV